MAPSLPFPLFAPSLPLPPFFPFPLSLPFPLPLPLPLPFPSSAAPTVMYSCPARQCVSKRHARHCCRTRKPARPVFQRGTQGTVAEQESLPGQCFRGTKGAVSEQESLPGQCFKEARKALSQNKKACLSVRPLPARPPPSHKHRGPPRLVQCRARQLGPRSVWSAFIAGCFEPGGVPYSYSIALIHPVCVSRICPTCIHWQRCNASAFIGSGVKAL